MPIFLINSVHYHVETWGKRSGSSAPILMLHGFTGSAEHWTRLAALLKEHHQIIAVDLLGHGLTDAPDDPTRYQMGFAAADLVALIALLGTGPVHVLGYSMGGRLALYMALHYHELVRSLTLESASPGLATEAERQARQVSDEALANRIERDGIARFVDYWATLPLFATQKRLPEVVRSALHMQRVQNNPRGLANSLRGMGTGVQPSLWESLGQVSAPTLLFSGALDTKFTAIAQQMHTHIPGSELVTIPDVGHTIHLESATTMINNFSAFVNKLKQWNKDE